jgi:aspartate 1-decarboxylase
MLIQVLKSKIHRVTVTEANLEYIGSITIDQDLMDAAGIIAGERVYIVDNNNGERFDTYAIAGARGTGVVCLNGAAARRVHVGDIVIILAYAMVSPEEGAEFRPKIIFPNTATNKL